MRQRLPEPLNEAVTAAISLTERSGDRLYLVGGAVRDLLLGAPLSDIDLVVEGDAIVLARALGESLRARVVEHPRFGTAVLQGDGFRLDVAGARNELYLRPGALPTVGPASMEEDLGRRDFTINAMALRLAPERAGELIDPFHGQADLKRRQLRILHGESFQDDATRIYRAMRYAARFGFRLERKTAGCFRRDRAYLETISGTRLRHEFERIAEEARVADMVRMAERWGVLEATHPAFALGRRSGRALSGLRALRRSHRAAVLFCLLLAQASPVEAEDTISRLELTRRQAAAVAGFLAIRHDEGSLNTGLLPSRVFQLLSPRPVEAVEAFVLNAPARAASRARRYLEEWRLVRPRLSGQDLQRLGIASGPALGSMLSKLRAARMDGNVRTKEDEVALVRKSFGSEARRSGD